MASNSVPDGRSQPLNFKIVLLGEGAVGKTSLVLRYVDNKFNDKHLSTLQVCTLHYFQRVHSYLRAVTKVSG